MTDELSPEDQLAALTTRYLNGIAWIQEHDPDGSFYVWIKSGLTPASRMPAQTPERQEAWALFYKNFRLWEALDVRLAGLEQQMKEAIA